ncbi:MAG: hypothetical protein M0P10_07360 [Sphaerochaetaceae bacterium]|nr:hypothetical protein [Sphaerochaetaceae bacterium]
MPFSKEFKKSFIEEFLERYQKDQNLSFRKYGMDKLGRIHSSIYVWLKEFDVNNICTSPNPATYHKSSVSSKNEIIKITDQGIVTKPKSQAKISIKVGDASIDMGTCYSKEDLVLVLSALKEVRDAD